MLYSYAVQMFLETFIVQSNYAVQMFLETFNVQFNYAVQLCCADVSRNICQSTDNVQLYFSLFTKWSSIYTNSVICFWNNSIAVLLVILRQNYKCFIYNGIVWSVGPVNHRTEWNPNQWLNSNRHLWVISANQIIKIKCIVVETQCNTHSLPLHDLVISFF